MWEKFVRSAERTKLSSVADKAACSMMKPVMYMFQRCQATECPEGTYRKQAAHNSKVSSSVSENWQKLISIATITTAQLPTYNQKCVLTIRKEIKKGYASAQARLIVTIADTRVALKRFVSKARQRMELTFGNLELSSGSLVVCSILCHSPFEFIVPWVVCYQQLVSE